MKRTLFITSNRLGDAVLTTGVLRHLLNTEPDSKITVVCGKIPAPIFRSMSELDKVVAISKRKRSLHWWDAFREINGFFWHRIVDFRGSPLGYLPARHRHLWKGGNDQEHKLVSNAKLIGVSNALMPEVLVSNGNLPDEKILAIAPTANSYKKQWHFENYIELAKNLTQENGILPRAKILVLGAPGEEEQALPVVNSLPKKQVLDYVGKTDPFQAAELLARVSLFVGNDSGLMHTAVAVGIPTVGLFGIGKPTVYSPYGDKSLCLVGEPRGEQITRKEMAKEDGSVEVIETLPLERVEREVTEFYKKISG